MTIEVYCTAGEVKAVMPDSTWGTTYDTILGVLASRASRSIDMHVKRWPGYFSAQSGTRYYDGCSGLDLLIDELAGAPTSVGVSQTGEIDGAGGTGGVYVAYDPTDYLLWPYNASGLGQPYRKMVLDIQNGNQNSWYGFRKGIKIVAPWGYSTSAGLPEVIKQASIIQTIRWFKRGQQGYQDVGAIVELGQLKYVQKLDPDIAEVIDNFMEVTL